MAQLPTLDELARKVLDVFARNDSRPGHALMPGVFLAQGKFVGLGSQDVADALQAAANNAWIEEGPNGTVRLTESGFAAM